MSDDVASEHRDTAERDAGEAHSTPHLPPPSLAPINAAVALAVATGVLWRGCARRLRRLAVSHRHRWRPLSVLAPHGAAPSADDGGATAGAARHRGHAHAAESIPPRAPDLVGADAAVGGAGA